MAEAALKTLDCFNCPICLDLLKDPDCWAEDDQMGVYSCPQCRHSFTPRPVLNKNTMLAELAEGLRTRRLQAAPPAGSPAGSGGVECDVCTGTKLRAVKSCLACLASYCEAHIQPHYESPALKKHKLVEVFCHTDQQCVCLLCVMDEHSGHKTVSAEAERSEKQKQLVEKQRKFQQRIQQTENKLRELRQAMDNLRRSAQAAVEDSEKIFTELIESIERRHSEVKELIRAQEKTELNRAEDLLKKLEQEIADLRRRDAELEQLSHSEDHIHFLQVTSLTLSSSTEGVSLNLRLVRNNADSVLAMEQWTSFSLSRRLLRGHITLDPNTAHSQLSLSKTIREVKVEFWPQNHPDRPERFDRVWQVLCRESLTGRCYWEVEFSRNYINIAVSYKGVSRKGNQCRFGSNDQSWSLICSDSRFFFRHNNKQTELPVKSSSSRIGVYVDHRAGILSFYSVSDTMTLLHRVHTTFTQPLYPGFGLYDYGNVLQICDPK
uniref:B30.2/SPRY domain-containing protein n=1 Tax=Pygocentrus nattereri TaxID=42514 RepID=A0A3B4EAU6_PYGNA